MFDIVGIHMRLAYRSNRVREAGTADTGLGVSYEGIVIFWAQVFRTYTSEAD